MSEDVKSRSGFAALIGRPNVGKSTLMNHLAGQKIAITSPRPQTTRNRIRTIYTDERGQIVFVDTPGIHKAKNKLGDYMMKTVNRSINDADLVLWLVEPSDKIAEKDREIAGQLKGLKCPVILVINKVDTVERGYILKVIDAYKDLCSFTEILPVSALKETNLDELLDVVYENLPYGPHYFDDDAVTDEPVRAIAAELIREKALRLLNQEIPHGIAVLIDRVEYRENKNGGIYDVDATIVCERDSHKGIIIGKGGLMLKQIGSQARPEIEELLEARVNLKLFVKVRENWRDISNYINDFGYRDDDK
ncbi:MAG: GTPase Era [Lachnospiraceae bacterium]|nr:GTPase Era [Lachnospiraceae bacterium]